MDEGRVVYYLEIWRDWMQPKKNNGLGYPSRSMGFGDSGIHSTEDYEESQDLVAGPAVDACIESLSDIEKTAVNVRWLAERTLINPIMIDLHYGIAVTKLAKKLQDKGLY